MIAEFFLDNEVFLDRELQLNIGIETLKQQSKATIQPAIDQLNTSINDPLVQLKNKFAGNDAVKRIR